MSSKHTHKKQKKKNIFVTKIYNKEKGCYEDFRYVDNNLTQKATSDVNMLVSEVYNPNAFDIAFKESLVARRGGKERLLICKSGEFMILPHNYFVIHADTNEPFDLVRNYGDDMRKGNKVGKRLEDV